MNGLFRHNSIFAAFAGAAAIVFSVFIYFSGEKQLALAQAGMTLVLLVVFAAVRLVCKRKYAKLVLSVTERLNVKNREELSEFPLPCMVCNENGDILWLNRRFVENVAGGRAVYDSAGEYLNGIDLAQISQAEETAVAVNGRSFSVFSTDFTENNEKRTALFFVDFTSLRKTEKMYEESRPFVILVETDSVGNARYDFRDSERAEIRSMIEKEIEDWTSQYSCLFKRISGSRYMIVAEKSDIDLMCSSKFAILDKVRELKYQGLPISATLSIGASDGDSFEKCGRGARKALDMALGRGGDQAAVSVDGNYRFFGGVSKSLEKGEKVKSRVISDELFQRISESNEVIVMGHRFPDLDVMGAALGICCAAKAAGVPSYIATDCEKSLALNLIKKIMNDPEYAGSIIDFQQASKLLDKKTLLVVVDTHLKSFVEFPELLQKASTVFVIDHHRKGLDYIENAVVFHLDPGASSASEMVTELLQYGEAQPRLSKTVAEALLAGIMLDTKNFVLRSGARTFEAAAFLRRNDANTVSVKKLFSTSMENNKLRNKIVSSAKIYNGCAVTVSDSDSPDVRVISAQAADELLNITGVKASFVLYSADSAISISARSLGEMNVQLVMEALGGGGHLTMAACRLNDDTFESAVSKLVAAIDSVDAANGNKKTDN